MQRTLGREYSLRGIIPHFRFGEDPGKVSLDAGRNGAGISRGNQEHMPVFAKLLRDCDDKVRMEAPEIFRVLGKRRPDFVAPYLDELRRIAETDTNRVVRIHCQGAIRAAIGTNDYLCLR